MESIETGMDSDFRDYSHHLQSGSPILCNMGYMGYHRHSHRRSSCDFHFFLENRAITV